jgi:hypothetical protein
VYLYTKASNVVLHWQLGILRITGIFQSDIKLALSAVYLREQATERVSCLNFFKHKYYFVKIGRRIDDFTKLIKLC